MHRNQRKIIYLLSQKNGQRYSQLYKHFTESDKFAYHIKQLLSQEFISKRDEKYYLAKKGAWETQNFEAPSFEDKKLKIPINLFICKFKDKYLIRSVFAEDTEGKTYYALPGIKAKWGDTYDIVFTTGIQKKFGISGTVDFLGTYHLLERTIKGDILFDDILILFTVNVTAIHEITKNSLWLTYDEIAKLEKRHIPVDRFILQKENKSFGIIETISHFNLRDEEI